MLYKVKKPFLLTLFGASGDLAKDRLFPAIYQLAAQKRLPANYAIIGFARTEKTQIVFREEFAAAVRKKNGKYTEEKILHDLLQHLFYFQGQYKDHESFVAYKHFLKQFNLGKNVTHVAYFSIPPSVYADVAKHFSTIRDSKKDNVRLIIEKPFGDSLASAETLYHHVVDYFPEDEIYLLDHYLGKQSVQSIFEMRRVNRLLNLMIRGSEVANIQISAFEDIGIGERVGYFENTGIIKDMIQSHLLQTLAILTMSIPTSMEASSMQRERHSLLSAIKAPATPDDIVLGQYKGYKSEKGVPKSSKTETFVALRLFIDREDWQGIPIYLRTGKRTHEKHTFVTIELKKFAWQDKNQAPNRVIVEIQPFPRFHIKLLNKLGPSHKYQEVATSDSIACDIDGCLPDHASLILDAIRGERVNFLSFPEILATWGVTDAVIDQINKHSIRLHPYADGSEGPKAQNHLPKKDGFAWYDVDM